MRYLISKANEHQEEIEYRVYITDGLYAMTTNRQLTERFYDKYYAVDDVEENADEIVLDVIANAGLKVSR